MEISINHVKMHQYHFFPQKKYAILCYILVWRSAPPICLLYCLIIFGQSISISSFYFLEYHFAFDETCLELQVEAVVTTELSIHLHTKIWFAESATYSAVPLSIFLKLATRVNGHFLQRLSRKVPVAPQSLTPFGCCLQMFYSAAG